MIEKDWWSKTLRIAITGLIYGVYIALVFFSFRGNIEFLFTFEYWTSVTTTTLFSLMLRWLYSDTGVEKEIRTNEDIKLLEKGKSKLVTQVNSSNLTGELKRVIDNANIQNKIQAYKDKCDRKINYYREKGVLKPFRKSLLNKWRERKEFMNNDEFNINSIRVPHYKYDIDEMLSSFYKEHNNNKRYRIRKNQKVLSSLKTNVLTLFGIMLIKALEILEKGFTKEDLLVLGGQLITFTINIYTGYNLGKDYIKSDYSSNLTDDYVFLKDFLSKQGLHSETDVV